MTTRQEAIAKAKAPKLSRQEALAKAKASQPEEPASEVHPALKMIDDVLSAGAQGVYKGVLATPGLPGTIQEWARSLPAKTPAGQWLKDTGESLLSSLPNKGQLPTSQDILNTYEEKVTPFKEYEGLPAYAERAGEFFTPLPGQKLNLARDAITALGAGVGSKGGEDIAKALKASPAGQAWADLIGTITGTYLSKGKKANTIKIAAKGAPSPDELATDVTNKYGALANQPLDVNEFYNTLQDIDAETRKRSLLPREAAPHQFNQLAELERRSWTPGSFVLGDVEALRQSAAARGRTLDPSNTDASRMGKIIAAKIDDYYGRAAPGRADLQAEIDAAREVGRSQSLDRDIEAARASGDFSQMSEAIGHANKMRAYSSSRKGRSLSDVERQGIKDVVGPSMRNPLRIFSRGLQGFLTQGAGVAGAMTTATMSPLVYAALAGLIGKTGEKIADARTLRKLDDIQAAIRAGRPAQEAAAVKAAGINKRKWDSLKATGILGTLRSQAIGD